ncbi:hypothetical protein AVEN_272233-1 [Araneus ventricosus]|uniref:Uncharacterized protein n=1 Tax=Araneus ventricosus TaxID=182803 RepID=A0A4Y2FZ79_ARAVE|nr:hypothetical protein AVEN_272233-1 [Araneus ventricosus]
MQDLFFYDLSTLGIQLSACGSKLRKVLNSFSTPIYKKFVFIHGMSTGGKAFKYYAADEIAFYGVNSESECLLVRIARGNNQQADAWVYLKLGNGKTYYLMETKGFQQSLEGNSQSFSCGKLQMHYLCPMRRWRIFYCGMLREISDNNKKVEEVVFAKFVFLWKAGSDVYDCTLDSNPHGFASAMARSDWRAPFVPPIKNLVDALNIYGQSGVISGTVSINDGEDYEMYLFGAKIRSLGKSASFVGCKFTTILGSTPSYYYYITDRQYYYYITDRQYYYYSTDRQGTSSECEECLWSLVRFASFSSTRR